MENVILHKKEIVINKERLRKILDKKSIGFINLYEMIVDKFGLDITYKGFMNLMDNRSSWKFLYAYAVMDVLDLKTDDIFDVIDINIEEKVREKKEWRNKYQRNK